MVRLINENHSLNAYKQKSIKLKLNSVDLAGSTPLVTTPLRYNPELHQAISDPHNLFP
jgi:hypothetical protein